MLLAGLSLDSVMAKFIFYTELTHVAGEPRAKVKMLNADCISSAEFSMHDGTLMIVYRAHNKSEGYGVANLSGDEAKEAFEALKKM